MYKNKRMQHLYSLANTTLFIFYLNGSQLHSDRAQAAQLIAVYM